MKPYVVDAYSPANPADRSNTDLRVGNTNTADVSPFIDEKRLCADLQISSVTATKWRARAEGPRFIKVGRLVRYRRSDVEAWLLSRTVGRQDASAC